MRITLKFDENGETKIRTNSSYKEGERISKLDFLKDCIGILTEKYNKELENWPICQRDK